MRQTFYVLHEGQSDNTTQRLGLLEQACRSRGVLFQPLDSLRCDYSQLPQLGPSDLLYNCARGSQVLESLLLNPQVTTFYIRNPDYTTISSTTTFSMVHDRMGLPAPKTIYALTSDRELLQRYVDQLGGFPLVLKAETSTMGIGTIKVDGWQTLVSLADHLVASGQKFILRQFISAPFGARAMVLGHHVVGVLKFLFPPGEFRNAARAADVRYESHSLTTEQEALCVAAVRGVNLEMGGVDLLFDAQGKAYLLEVNLPTGFQAFSDDPWRIQEQWLDHLLAKARASSEPTSAAAPARAA